jgi:hypothetical protein
VGGGTLRMLGAGQGPFADPTAVVDGANALWDCTVALAGWTKDRLTDMYNSLPAEWRFLADLVLGYDTNRTQWAAKLVCDIIVTVVASVFTGGAYAATRYGAKATIIVNKLRKLLPDLPGNRRDRDGAPDRDGGDGDGDDCPTNSFPTGTLVLTPGGSRVAIEDLRPGDHVLAADADTGSWSVSEVLAQWSHVDQGRMGALTLADGSRITATDHHRFWVANTQMWRQLDEVRPADLLLTPDGLVAVAFLVLSPPTKTLVWELDTAVGDSFTVFTGTSDVLVHNEDEPLPPADDPVWDKAELIYEPYSKHHPNAGAEIGPEPSNPQALLKKSVVLGPNTDRRIAFDPATGKYAVFDWSGDGPGSYHGHTRSWGELSNSMKAVLSRSPFFLNNRNGRPTSKTPITIDELPGPKDLPDPAHRPSADSGSDPSC